MNSDTERFLRVKMLLLLLDTVTHNLLFKEKNKTISVVYLLNDGSSIGFMFFCLRIKYLFHFHIRLLKKFISIILQQVQTMFEYDIWFHST